MKFSRYYLIIVFRVIFITLNCYALVFFYTRMQRPVTTGSLILLLLFQVILLISYLNRINRDLANFLVFLQENDTTLAFSRNRIERSFNDITRNLGKIIQKVQDARIATEQKQQYLQAVIQHVGVGLISFNEHGSIELINDTTRELLGMNNIQDVSDITDRYPELAPVFNHIDHVGHSLVNIKLDAREMALVIKSQGLRFNGTKIKLVSLQNIKPELEKNELDAWKKLIRILRHEIMNSITPITTLTTAINRCFRISGNRKPLTEITEINIEDALLSTQVIEERSQGLIDFVEKFRSITDIPIPRYASFEIEPMLRHILHLFDEELKAKNIVCQLDVDKKQLQMYADPHLMEQVLINLIKNSIEAMMVPGGKIILKVFKPVTDKICIQVLDNGSGIGPDDLENVFMPSYSTKVQGMGIGLSISRQIIQLHQGSLSAFTDTSQNTVLEILLPDKNQ